MITCISVTGIKEDARKKEGSDTGIGTSLGNKKRLSLLADHVTKMHLPTKAKSVIKSGVFWTCVMKGDIRSIIVYFTWHI